MKCKFFTAVLLFLSFLPILGQTADQAGVVLSDKERDWIVKHPVLIVGNEMDWPPFDFAEGKEARGYSIDLIRQLEVWLPL